MKKRLLAVLLAAILLVAVVVTAAAYTPSQMNTADALNELGLFLGMGTAGYALDQNLTRVQGITLLVRMIGKEAAALAFAYQTPFVDVPEWAAGYVGYAYTNAITNGMGPDKFGSDAQLSDYMFLTLVLRALGYTDAGENAQFIWNDPYALAKKVGLIDIAAADGSFTRGDAVEVFWNAMNAEIVSEDMTLAESLIEQGIFTSEEFAAARKIRINGRVEDADKGQDSTIVITPNPDEDEKENVGNGGTISGGSAEYGSPTEED